MHRPISWSALADASVGVWGLGVEGRASVRRLHVLGCRPVLVDDAPVETESDGGPVLVTAQGGLDALARCEVVVKSPGISPYREDAVGLEEAGVILCGGLGLFMEEADLSRVVCITGTKGKSTTTSMAVHLLNRLGYDARAGGNIGRPPWDPSTDPPPQYWIVETSSFQVPDLPIAPEVVAVTSLAPDHLDWHGTLVRYYSDKLSLCTKPGVRVALVNGADDQLRAHAALLGTHVQWVDAGDVARDTSWAKNFGLPGAHNASNASLARAVLAALGIPEARDAHRLATAAQGLEPLPSRCRSLGRVGSVEFVDDSLATNVLPTRAALESFAERPVAVLVGGYDRGVDYRPLGSALVARTAPTLVVAMPDNGPRIVEAVRGAGDGRVQAIEVDGMAAAVDAAFAWTTTTLPDAVILLSPAAPSFGRFGDYAERAAAFAAAAARCGTLS